MEGKKRKHLPAEREATARPNLLQPAAASVRISAVGLSVPCLKMAPSASPPHRAGAAAPGRV